MRTLFQAITLAVVIFVFSSLGSALVRSVFAAPGSEPEGPELHVMPVDPDLNAQSLEKPNQVKVYTNRQVQQVLQGGIPIPGRRNALLERAGLESQVADWDEFERDMLLLRAQRHPVERLFAIYPKLPKERLRQLHQLIQAETPRGKEAAHVPSSR